MNKTAKNRIIFTLRLCFTALAAVGLLWFFLPIFRRGYNMGSVFGQLMSLALGFFALTTGKWKWRWLNITAYILLGVFIALLAWVAFLTVQINTAQRQRAIPPGTAVVVLGAKVLKSGPSLSLQNRLDAALVQLERDPTAPCIVTGGQGWDEPRTEASVARDYLVKKGISPQRIFLEDRSVNTQQNMAYSMEIARREGLGSNLAIATQGFHQYRSSKLARDVGFVPYALVAYTNPLLYPGYYGRELLSMTKYYLEKLLGR